MIKKKKTKVIRKKKAKVVGKAVNVEDLKSVVAAIGKVIKEVGKENVEQIVGKIDCFSTMVNKKLDDFVSLESKFTEAHFKTMLISRINELINSKGSSVDDTDIPNGYIGIKEFPQQFVTGNPVVTCTQIYQTLNELRSDINKYMFILPVYFNKFKPINEQGYIANGKVIKFDNFSQLIC